MARERASYESLPQDISFPQFHHQAQSRARLGEDHHLRGFRQTTPLDGKGIDDGEPSDSTTTDNCQSQWKQDVTAGHSHHGAHRRPSSPILTVPSSRNTRWTGKMQSAGWVLHGTRRMVTRLPGMPNQQPDAISTASGNRQREEGGE